MPTLQARCAVSQQQLVQPGMLSACFYLDRLRAPPTCLLKCLARWLSPSCNAECRLCVRSCGLCSSNLPLFCGLGAPLRRQPHSAWHRWHVRPLQRQQHWSACWHVRGHMRNCRQLSCAAWWWHRHQEAQEVDQQQRGAPWRLASHCRWSASGEWVHAGRRLEDFFYLPACPDGTTSHPPSASLTAKLQG